MAQLDGALLALASVAALAAASRLQRTGSAARPPLQVASFAPGTLFHIREGGSGRGAWPHYGGRPTELVLEPRVPRLPASRQDTTTPRVSLAPRLGGAFWGLGFQNIRADAPGGNDWEVYTNAETVSGTLPTPMEVPDVDETGEVWGLDPVPVRWVRTLTPAQIWKGRDAAWARLGWHPQLRRPPTDWTVEMNAPRKYVWAAIEEALGRGSAAQHVVTSQKWEISSGTYTAAQALDELIWNLWDARYLEFYDLDESASQQQVRTQVLDGRTVAMLRTDAPSYPAKYAATKRRYGLPTISGVIGPGYSHNISGSVALQGPDVVVIETELMGTVMLDADEIDALLQAARDIKRRLKAQGRTEGYVGGDVGGQFTVDEAAILVDRGEATLEDPALGVDFLVVRF